MLIIPFQTRGGRRRTANAVPVPAELLTLIAATYIDATSVTLTFDRAIDISAIEAGAIVVNDPENTGEQFAGWAAQLVSPAAVRLTLVDTGGAIGTATSLTVSETNGITPATGGAAWAGVSELPLPFP